MPRIKGVGMILKDLNLLEWANALTAFAVGYLLAKGKVDSTFWYSLGFFTLPYHLLLHAPDLLVEGKWKASKKRWILVTILAVNVPYIALLLTIYPLAAKYWLAVIVVVALSWGMHSVRFKNTPLLDVLSAGMIAISPLVLGLLLCDFNHSWLPAVGSLFVWSAANELFRSIHLIPIFKQKKLPTTATLMGLNTSITVIVIMYVIAGSLISYFYGEWGALIAFAMIPYVLNVARFYGVKNPELFMMGWKINKILHVLVLIFAGLLVAYTSF